MIVTAGPAYGRDYKSAKDVRADWVAGKDFQVLSIGEWAGKMLNKQDAKKAGLTVNIRYKKLTEVVVLKPTKS